MRLFELNDILNRGSDGEKLFENFKFVLSSTIFGNLR